MSLEARLSWVQEERGGGWWRLSESWFVWR